MCRHGVCTSQNAFFKRWDIVIVLALLFTATVTPFEVAFLRTSVNTIFFVNRAVDCVFLVVRVAIHSCGGDPILGDSLLIHGFLSFPPNK